jgi:HEAT repeat protein
MAVRWQAGPALRPWLGLPAERVGYLLHFMALAVTLAAAKVILNTIAVALFLAKVGPSQLPLFYILLAAAAILLSMASSRVIDRVPRIALGRTAFLGTLLGAAALRIPIGFDLPAAYYAVLASAHIYEIVLDIVFWVVVAAFLDTIELKRGTPLIYMALATGGVAGGVFASALSPFVPAEDLLLALPVLGLIATAQFGFARRRLRELHDAAHGEPDKPGPVEHLRVLSRLITRYPLILLIALNAATLTILYGLCEYLVLTVYAERFDSLTALTRFLAIIFAGIQALEFALLYLVSRPLLERAGPVARNLIFPATSLACLIGLAVGPKLPAAIATHINAEAVSNAVFQPVNNTNYLALPLRFHGRIRTLADGIFYPAGLALAGAMLITLQARLAPEQINFVAITFALVFVLLNVGAGVLFLPAMVRNLRSGIAHFADAAPGVEPVPGLADQIGPWLQSEDPETRTIALRLAARLDPAPFLDLLRGLAPAADRPTRRAIASLLARAPAARLAKLLDELLDSGDRSSQLIALQAKLARGDQLAARQAQRLTRSPHQSVAAVAALAVTPSGPLAELPGCCRDAETAADVLDACAQAGRPDLADLLVKVIEAAPLEQQREGLAVLGALVAPEHAAAAALGRRFAHDGDARLRVEAVGLLGALAGSPGTLEVLAGALGDRSRLVRERAADALATRGDAAIELALAGLKAADPDRVEAAIRTLGRIGSRRAAEALSALPEPMARDVARNLDWLRQLPPGPERAPWRPLELAIEDHNRRIVSLVLNVLAALGEERSVAHLRDALAAPDRRTRANALEALLSLPQRRLVQPILPLLEARYAIDGSIPQAPAGSPAELALILTAAGGADDRWIRLGAACTAHALGAAPDVAHGNPSPAAPASMAARSGGTPTESDMETILLLKRVPLFRYLPLDTLLAVSRVLERRHYIAGETIVEADAHRDHFCLLETGEVDLLAPGGETERLIAPAHFGELVLADQHGRAPKVIAVGDCTLLRLHRIAFHDLSRDYPDMLMELCKLLARRLRRAEDRARTQAVRAAAPEPAAGSSGAGPAPDASPDCLPRQPAAG